ncbi:hypothetical protein EAD05_24000, partial [Salmonella enterica]|nr:hypothetical protein [Salmonella enterica]
KQSEKIQRQYSDKINASLVRGFAPTPSFSATGLFHEVYQFLASGYAALIHEVFFFSTMVCDICPYISL